VVALCSIACGDSDDGSVLPAEERSIVEPDLPNACDISTGVNACVPIAFEALASQTLGKIAEISTAGQLPDAILTAIEQATGDTKAAFDLMIVIDGTGSMLDELQEVQARVDDILNAVGKHAEGSRVGVAQYRDVCFDDDWLVFHDLTGDLAFVREVVMSLTAKGGGDIPESIYDAVYQAVTRATWTNHLRFIVLIGDSHPHTTECTEVSFTQVVETAQSPEAGGIAIFPIIVALTDAAADNPQLCAEIVSRIHACGLDKTFPSIAGQCHGVVAAGGAHNLEQCVHKPCAKFLPCLQNLLP